MPNPQFNPLAATLITAMFATAAHGETIGKLHFDIPAQPLDQALLQFGKQSRQPLLYNTDLTNQLRSLALHGNYTATEAMAILLGNAPLQAVANREGALTLMPKANPLPEKLPSPSATTLPQVKVTGKADYDETDPRNTFYKRTNASTATKTDTPIMDTPVSIQVIPKKILDDQQAYNVKEALKNVSGVQLSTSPTNYENFVIRGFDASGAIYKNGLRQDSFAEETANLQGIEVLKGPAAMLYGRIEPGGLVNLQTAQPLSTPYYSLQQQVGSYDFYRTTLDATGPVNNDKSVLYRLNFAYRDNKSFRDLSFMDRVFLAPSLTWHISDRTQANILLEYQNDDFRSDYGFPAVGNRPANLPINRSLTDPAAHDGQESKRVFTNLSHEFNDDWKLTHRFMVSLADYTQFDIFTNPNANNDPSAVFTRALWGVHNNRDLYGTNLDLTGHFDLGISKHAVLAGTDYYLLDSYGYGHCCDAIPPVNSLDPQPTGQSAADLEAFPVNSYFTGKQEWNGVYFQDQITLWDKWHILGGGRYDWLTNGSSWVGTSLADAYQSQDKNQAKTEKFSPRVGLLYRPWQWLSVYGNYTEALGNSNWGVDRFGKPLAPQTAEQFEAGFKTELLDKRLSTSIAYFHITKQNIGMPDTATPQLNDRRAVGEARSQGLEVDINGSLTENWNLIASYAYTDTLVTKDASCLVDNGANCLQSGSGDVGHQLPNAAPNSGSLWTTYNLKDSFADHWLSGFNLGTGVFIVDRRQGILDNSFQLPGYVRWDASASYQWRLGKSKLTTQLNVRNILDQRYFAGADTYDQYSRGYGNIPGEPLTFLGSLKLEY